MMSKTVRSVVKRSQETIAEGKRLRAEARRLIEQAKQTSTHLAWLIEEVKRQRRPDFYRPLQDAIRAMHGCASRHVTAFAVRKVAEGGTVWEGTVEEFELLGHPQAERCYAWQYVGEGRTQSFSLLKLPPVGQPHQAVQMTLAAEELAQKIIASFGQEPEGRGENQAKRPRRKKPAA